MIYELIKMSFVSWPYPKHQVDMTGREEERITPMT